MTTPQTISRERLEQIASIYGKAPSLYEAQMMAQSMLAAMDSKPVSTPNYPETLPCPVFLEPGGEVCVNRKAKSYLLF